MARIVVFFTVICLVLAVTHGRFIVPEQTVSPEETVTVLPKPDHTISNVIDLPSEKPDSEQDTAVDFKNYDTLEADSDLDSFPLTMTSFRPVNGHFPRQQLIPFRHKHDCHFHKRFKPSNPRFQRKRYTSYDNDMVLSDEKTGPHIHSRRGGFSDDSAESMEDVEEFFRKPRHYNNGHEHEQDHDDEHHRRYHYNHRHHRRGEEDERRKIEGQEGGLVKRFRKFLTKF
ncbi:hypothetical protein V6N13_077071 [Hibiscus sabdariffa]|uniref:Uncharacterized protein n=1 Tax=Hibiscus sabdariffa TaxID=183260 RepID=A0ABR2CNG4_9ROSI